MAEKPMLIRPRKGSNLNERVKVAADRAGLSAAEWLRRVVEAALGEPPDLDSRGGQEGRSDAARSAPPRASRATLGSAQGGAEETRALPSGVPQPAPARASSSAKAGVRPVPKAGKR